MAEIISSFNYESFEITGSPGVSWDNSTNANVISQEAATAPNVADSDSTKQLVQILFNDISLASTVSIKGIEVNVDLSNDIGGSTLVEVIASLTFNWNAGAGTAVIFGSSRNTQINIDDGGGNIATLGGSTDLWEVAVGSPEYNLLKTGNFGIVFTVQNIAGIGNFGINSPANYVNLFFEEGSDSTFRNRGGNRDRLNWGTR